MLNLRIHEIDAVTASVDVSKGEVAKTVHAVLDVIVGSVAHGEAVQLMTSARSRRQSARRGPVAIHLPGKRLL